jgi:RimJ/RimL family protein N-acetyltransferase
MVQMAVDQHAAINLFKKLGFRHEAILTEHVQDQHGQVRDLIIMAYFIRDFLEHYGLRERPDEPRDLLL